MSIEMTDTEIEAVHYTIGNLQIAGLFARLVDMQTEVDALTCEVEDLKAHIARLEGNDPC